MKSRKSPLLFIVVAIAALALSGCNSERKYAANKDTRFLGIMNSNPESYKHVSPATFELSTNEITNNENVSGDNITLLWGLVELTDY